MTDQPNAHIVILGAGLVGSLLSIHLAKEGYLVKVYEKRPDPRKKDLYSGRSINLALSDRGIKALKGAGVYEQIVDDLIPMHGRIIHDEEGNTNMQPYGKEGQHINSVSRNDLNCMLVDEAEKLNVHFMFEHQCEKVDTDASEITLKDPNGVLFVEPADLIVGADGAFSAVRATLQFKQGFNYSQMYLEHGYKEFLIPPKNGEFALDPNGLHIWPRKSFMFIALPNPDKSFTCTLFFRLKGEQSFESINTDEEIKSFFETYFKDLIPLTPDLLDQYHNNPASTLVTIKCSPWAYNTTLLIGDASHAIVPFYGQGMNAGFEDCTVLMETLRKHNFDFINAIHEFQKERVKDANAISDLALKNFIEMRDKVSDEEFVQRKKTEAKIHQQFPEIWTPQYSMVTFSESSYSQAFYFGLLQDEVMEENKDLWLNNEPSDEDIKHLANQFKLKLES